MTARVCVAIVKTIVIVAVVLVIGERPGEWFPGVRGGRVVVRAAQPAADEAAVRAVVSRFHNAVTTGDAAGAMTIVADDALFLEAGGVETRSEYEKNHLPGDIEFEKSVRVKRSALRVVIAGDAAWTTCTSEFNGTFQGRTIDSMGTELMVLSRRAGGWQIRAVHWSSRARPAK